MTVISKSGPSTAATQDLVRTIRGYDGTAVGATIGVTGLTAINIDISAKLGDALLPYLTVAVGLAFVLLTLVFRSLLVPVKATGGLLLRIAPAFGAVVAVFQCGWAADLLGVEQTGPIISFLPIFLHRHRVRPRNGLPGLPGHAHARGVRPRRTSSGCHGQRVRPRGPSR